MKKFVMFFFVALLFTTMFLHVGCSSNSNTDDSDDIVIGLTVEQPEVFDVPNKVDTLSTETEFTISGTLTGYTSSYKQINFYWDDDPNALEDSWDNGRLREFEENNPLDANFTQTISTVGYMVGPRDLRVEVVATNNSTEDVTIPLYFKEPSSGDAWIDLAVFAPDTTEFDIGDMIEFGVELLGNNTIFSSFDAYIDDSNTPFETFTTFDDTLLFNYDTVDLTVGDHTVTFQLTAVNGDIKEKTFSFTMYEYIPTFDITDDAGVGYELKSVVQTYDGGYVTVASDPGLGTRLVKYLWNKDADQVDVLWSENISANVGIAESVCEDREYNGGVVLAGWRISDIDGFKDTWVRKVDTDDGSLIWNKQFGYPGIDDGATVIKKSTDDGYIIGGYTNNYYHAFDGGFAEFMIPGMDNNLADSVTYNWDTGYDVRLLKIYSNGNENWGHLHKYTSQRAWQDITGHTLWVSGITVPVAYWVRTMGDQFITDLAVKNDGTYLVTGWNNSRLYDGATDKDMFYAQFDNMGGYITTMSWSEMSCFDIDHIMNEDDFWIYFDIPEVQARLGDYAFTANHLGTTTEDEIGYGIVESFGGYDGDVVMAGETYEIDDTPVKSKFNDGWVVEFKINGDDDGAMWEYSFGDAEVEDKAFGIDQTKDDGYVVTGYTTGTDKETWTYKLNTQQLVVWSQKYNSTGDDWGVKALQTRDGGYITGGNVGTGAGVRARLIKVNKLGEFNE